LTLVAVTLFAAFVPARRATAVSPVETLRQG
jgi:ABC-type lipoprotein release transport system permease subunit